MPVYPSSRIVASCILLTPRRRVHNIEHAAKQILQSAPCRDVIIIANQITNSVFSAWTFLTVKPHKLLRFLWAVAFLHTFVCNIAIGF